jgi:peptidoglycan/LPS O-acetylase OafA/YrhL
MTANKRFDWLDGLRAIAVALVLLGHAKLAFQFELGRAGDIILRVLNAHVGVQIFFVISGFIITLLLLREKETRGTVNLKAFWRRRSFRILPALWVFLLTLACLQIYGLVTITPSTWLASFLFFRNHAGEGWFTGHLWSLGVEAQFYLLWPIFVAHFSPARLDLVLWVGIFLAAVSRLFAALLHIPVLSFYSLLGNLDLLMFGAMAAVYVESRHIRTTAQYCPQLPDKLAMKWVLPGLAIISLMFAFLTSTRWSAWAMVFEPMMMGTLVSLAITRAYGNRRAWRLLRNAPISLLGLWSYSLYLWQQLFLAPAGAWPENTWMRDNSIGMLFGLAAVSIASYYLIERTFNRLGHKGMTA